MIGVVHQRRIQAWMAAAVLATACAPSVCHAQTNDTLMLMNRLNDLESQVQQLRRQGGASSGNYGGMAPSVGGQVPAGGAADMEMRLGQLQEQVRNITGELETQSNQLAQMRTENQRLMQDIQMRMGDLEGKAGSPSSSGGPTPLAGRGGGGAADVGAGAGAPQAGTLGTLVPGPDGSEPASAAATPEKEYELAYNQLAQGDYAGAEQGFAQFLTAHPKSPLAANAKFWLGETYFQQGSNDQAAKTFAESFKQYSAGPKAPDSLLRLGMSLGQQGRTAQACLAFAQLDKKFPAASPKLKAQLAQERAQYACQ